MVNSACNYKRAYFDCLRADSHFIPWCILDGMPVDDAVNMFYSILQSAIADWVSIVPVQHKFPAWPDRHLRAAPLDEGRAHKCITQVGSAESAAECGEKQRRIQGEVLKPLEMCEFL